MDRPVHPVTQALLATLFTWGPTAAGALPVLFTKRFHQGVMDDCSTGCRG